MKWVTWTTGFLVLGALTCLPMGSAQALEGKGFQEQIVSCVGSSNVIVQAKKGSLVMIRVAPECDLMNPIVFKATKDRTVKVTASMDGRKFKHVVKVQVQP